MKSLKTLRILALIICLLLGASIIIAKSFLDINVTTALIVYGILVIFIVVTLYLVGIRKKEETDDIVSKLSKSAKIAIEEGQLGILVYDADYNITFMSSLFTNKGMNYVGEKLLNWLPDIQNLLDGTSERCIVVINEEKYEVSKRSDGFVLVFRDISKEYDLEKKLKEESYVLGLCNFDNYDESSESEDTITFVNTDIKIPVMDYFKKHGIVYRTLRNNRLQLILNYSKYEELFNDRFSILNVVRKASKKADLDITLSMAFAYGYDDLSELDNETSNLLEIAQTRGGDQVVVREEGKEAVFYGGSSEAREKHSKVKVRVMSNSIKNLIQESSNVIIIGHSDADSDCIGSMLGMSCIVNSLNKEAYVVSMSGEIEPMTKDVINKYKNDIVKEHRLVSENEALNHLDEDSLVVMCDHHSFEQSNCQNILKQASKIIIIDHHRRKADLDVNTTMLYVEASSSSTCEMITEFFTYMPGIQVSDIVANIMYLGIVIDTNHFRVRTGSRTFDAAKTLRNIGADPILVETLVQEPFENVKKRIELITYAEKYTDDVVVSSVNTGVYPRSIASQASDTMIKTKDTEAVFVICYTTSDEAIITARSKGKINVQVILERMNGGGHMTAAGLQRKNTSVEDLSEELKKVLHEYLMELEDIQDESNNA